MTISLVNTYYPIDYLAITGVDQFQQVDPRNFWSSAEQLPPAIETLLFDFGSSRYVNYVDFEILSKPIDLLIQWNNNGVWTDIEDNPDFNNQQSISYIPGLANPWIYIERHFDTIQTQQIQITFTRRIDPFPFTSSIPFNWSIDVRNTRFIYIIDSESDFSDVENDNDLDDSFNADQGIDILGNTFRTELYTYPATNATDGNTNTFWKSQPNPVPSAVEALYIDMRIGSNVGTMSFEDQANMSDLDVRSMTDMEDYYSDTVVVDDIYLDPITFGASMHIYYSLDDTPDWDNKLWIPIPQHYILKKGYHALPTSTTLKYLKLEFTNLIPIPYDTPQYPKFHNFTYRQYPTWVQNYFNGTVTGVDSFNSFQVDPFDHVIIEPLQLGYTKPEQDLLDSDIRQLPITELINAEQELQIYLQGIVSQQQQLSQSQQEQESQILFNNTFIWQTDMTKQLDTSGALSRFAVEGESIWNTEQSITILAPPAIQSVPDLSESQAQKQAPIMWFPFTCRHAYQTINISRTDTQKIAYYVAIREFGAYRRYYTTNSDEDYYIENFDDTQNIASNDFTQVDWRWTVTP